jgi:cytosine/adenosine deaminase-related metal-dependent hydrolase
MSSLKLTNIGQLITYDSEVNEMLTHENVEVAIEKDQIVDIGKDLGDADQIVNCDRKLVTPGVASAGRNRHETRRSVEAER